MRGMKILQFNCLEGEGVDLHQANAVLRHKPTFIFFESPGPAKSIFNKYKSKEKPAQEFKELIRELKKAGKEYPWVNSDVYTFNNIKKLWDEGHDIKLYPIDGPSELLRVNLQKFSKLNNPHPERRGTHFAWWVRMYLREKIMTQSVRGVLKSMKNNDAGVGLVFVQKFHWKNVQFHLSNPTKEEMYKYYFGAFKNINPENIGVKVKEANPILYKYWKKYSDFK
jgi:hypothetical protein